MTYTPAIPPATTTNPKRKLGDVVVLEDAISFLEDLNPNVFNTEIVKNHPLLIQNYFDAPYPAALLEAFGLNN